MMLNFLKKYRRRFGLVALIVAFGGGVFWVPTLDFVDHYFSSNDFCAKACHVMEGTVYKELQQSKHWTNSEAVRPKCGSCHLHEHLTMAMWDHVIGLRDLYSFIFKGIRTPEDIDKIRPELANKVRMEMLADGNKPCLRCHVFEGIKPKKKRGQRQHADAVKKNTPCIACHYNLVHKEIDPSTEFEKATEDM